MRVVSILNCDLFDPGYSPFAGGGSDWVVLSEAHADFVRMAQAHPEGVRTADPEDLEALGGWTSYDEDGAPARCA